MATRRRRSVTTIMVGLIVLLNGVTLGAAVSAGPAVRALPLADSPSLQPTSLTCGQPVAGSIAAEGQQDNYAFAAATGDRIWVTMLKMGGDASFTPGVAVYAPSGTASVVRTYPLTLTASSVFDTATQPFTLAVVGPLAPFTDDPLAARSTRVKVAHLTERREAINALRTFYSLSPFAWTDATPVAEATVVTAAHLIELRTALNEVYIAAGRTPPTYTDPTVTSRVTVITAVQIEEIRSAVRGIW